MHDVYLFYFTKYTHSFTFLQPQTVALWNSFLYLLVSSPSVSKLVLCPDPPSTFKEKMEGPVNIVQHFCTSKEIQVHDLIE